MIDDFPVAVRYSKVELQLANHVNHQIESYCLAQYEKGRRLIVACYLGGITYQLLFEEMADASGIETTFIGDYSQMDQETFSSLVKGVVVAACPIYRYNPKIVYQEIDKGDHFIMVRLAKEYSDCLHVGDPVEIFDFGEMDSCGLANVAGVKKTTINNLTGDELTQIKLSAGKSFMTRPMVMNYLATQYEETITPSTVIVLLYLTAATKIKGLPKQKTFALEVLGLTLQRKKREIWTTLITQFLPKQP